MDNYEELRWFPEKTTHILKNEWIDFRQMAYRVPDGRVLEPFYTYSRRSYVVIVATDTEGRYICVRQYRFGIDEVTTEFVAGGIETGSGVEYEPAAAGKAESTLEAAKRELMEETGYVSGKWTHLMSLPSNATISDNYGHIFLAEDCTQAGSPQPDDYEFLKTELLTAEELETRIREGKFQQSMHVLAWFLARQAR